jgi:hypothetical protein
MIGVRPDAYPLHVPMPMSPAPRREPILVAAAFAVLALLRLATLAPDPWEWDEVLFMEGVRDGLDVRVNHPHAPGYPVFIRFGQAIHALGVEPFRATALALRPRSARGAGRAGVLRGAPR